MSRVILIGDLHGCLSEAEELLDACKATPDDHVLFLGDLVDRGPDNGACVDLAMRVEARQGKVACILGNHERKHLDYDDVLASGRSLPPMPPTHTATREQLTAKHLAYFRRMPLFVRFPEHSAVAVHAGCFPGRSIESQTERHLLHIQCIRPYDFDEQGNMVTNEKTVWPSRVPPGEEGWRFWTRFWDGPELVVFGHSVVDRPLISDKAIGIDGGAVFGMQLHALVMPGREVVTVQSRTNMDRGRRRGAEHPIKSYAIHDDVRTFS